MKFFKNKLLVPIIISIIISIIFIILLSSTGIFDVAERKSLDLRFMYRFAPVSQSEDIVIIAIDDESLSKNQKPLLFWGKEFGTVIGKLSENNVKVIGLDYLQKIPLIDYAPENDEKFIQALLYGKTVLLTYVNEDGVFEQPPPSLAMAAAGPPDMEEILNNQNNKMSITLDNNFGAGNVYPDLDTFYRFQHLLINDKDNVSHASLALAVAAKYLDIELQELAETDRGIKLGDRIIDLYDQKNKSMYINFAGPAGNFPSIPFHKVLEEAEKDNSNYLKENFEGKIALIGITSMGQQDFVLTPYNTLLLNPKMMTGIEFHANTINTILEENYITRVTGLPVYILILLLALLTAVLCSLLDFTKGTICSVIMVLAYGAISAASFNFSGIWLETIAPITIILVCYGLTYIYNYIMLGKEKREINFMFERFVSAPIVKKMLSDPDSFKLGGEKKEVTILFSDINDFTTISEKTAPEDLIELLNSYLSLMTDIILESGGTLNQFVGDEIMVIYNAPIPQENHAKKAVQAGVAMLKKLDELREQGEMDIKVKIGIHTGEAVLGNVGSRKRMQYTGVGDTVNYASRVMTLNKETGTYFLISEETYKLVNDLEKDGIHFAPMERKTVKGKSGMYLTYEVKYDN